MNYSDIVEQALAALRAELADQIRRQLRENPSVGVMDVARKFLADQNVILPPDPHGLRGKVERGDGVESLPFLDPELTSDA